LPEHSPFADWKEARRFAGPLPFTFTYNKDTKEVLFIEGVRQNWTPNPVKVSPNILATICSCLGTRFRTLQKSPFAIQTVAIQ
jgi:hypothetical protein